MSVADIHGTVANQFILACQLEDQMVSEHPNRMAGRIKSEVIRDRNLAVSFSSLPATVEFRPWSDPPVILTGCEVNATRSERGYCGKR